MKLIHFYFYYLRTVLIITAVGTHFLSSPKCCKKSVSGRGHILVKMTRENIISRLINTTDKGSLLTSIKESSPENFIDKVKGFFWCLSYTIENNFLYMTISTSPNIRYKIIILR